MSNKYSVGNGVLSKSEVGSFLLGLDGLDELFLLGESGS